MTISSSIAFAGSSGSLAGRLELPRESPRAWALFAHCFTCGKDNTAAARISRALASTGIAVLRFDFTGLGQSDGEFDATGFSSNVEDLVCAADHLRTRYTAPSILIGHSLGGAAILAAARQIPETRAVATLGAPADPSHVIALLTDSLPEITASGQAVVTIAGRPFRVRKQFLDDIAAQPQRERIRTLGSALLILHSPADEVVPVDNARQIFELARHPKSFVAIGGADHLLSHRADADYIAALLAAWASRYLTAPPAEQSPPADTTATGVVRVTETRSGRFTQHISAGPHQLTADEPRPVGDDAGLTPYDLLLAGLGACTSMTVRMYADRNGWPLDRVTVELRHSRIHAEDCADCETEPAMMDRIDREIRFDGNLDTEQRARMLQIADKCPVHRTLSSGTDIHTSQAAPRKSG